MVLVATIAKHMNSKKSGSSVYQSEVPKIDVADLVLDVVRVDTTCAVQRI
jgi:hypothetical protein